jgi:uncharacterized DUF497 family protein
MTIRGLIWLAAIVEKLAVKHNVSIGEVEEVFENGPHFRFVESGFTSGEDVYSALGQSDAGRYLIIFFILKSDRRALVVSARDMTSSERKLYAKR